jgi:CRISPR-associated endoribonuclease Cas2 subtype I-E
MLEPKSGIFVGSVSGMVRDRLWEIACHDSRDGGCVMIHDSNTEQGFAIRSWGKSARLVQDLRAYFWYESLYRAVSSSIVPTCVGVNEADRLQSDCLERFLADWEVSQGEPEIPEMLPLTGKKVAVVEGGPAGLTVANFSNADLNDASFVEAGMILVNLSGANIQGADFSGATGLVDITETSELGGLEATVLSSSTTSSGH